MLPERTRAAAQPIRVEVESKFEFESTESAHLNGFQSQELNTP